jgi:hypothetical protein
LVLAKDARMANKHMLDAQRNPRDGTREPLGYDSKKGSSFSTTPFKAKEGSKSIRSQLIVKFKRSR